MLDYSYSTGSYNSSLRYLFTQLTTLVGQHSGADVDFFTQLPCLTGTDVVRAAVTPTRATSRLSFDHTADCFTARHIPLTSSSPYGFVCADIRRILHTIIHVYWRWRIFLLTTLASAFLSPFPKPSLLRRVSRPAVGCLLVPSSIPIRYCRQKCAASSQSALIGKSGGIHDPCGYSTRRIGAIGTRPGF